MSFETDFHNQIYDCIKAFVFNHKIMPNTLVISEDILFKLMSCNTSMFYPAYTTQDCKNRYGFRSSAMFTKRHKCLFKIK